MRNNVYRITNDVRAAIMYIRSPLNLFGRTRRSGGDKGRDEVHVANNRCDKRLEDLLPNGMRRAVQGASRGRKKSEEGGEKKPLFLSLSLNTQR